MARKIISDVTVDLLGWQSLTIAYINGWTAYGGGYGPWYRIDANGMAHFTGLVRANPATAVTVGTLPVGLRPIGPDLTTEMYWPLAGHNGSAYITTAIYIYPTGAMVIPSATLTSSWYSLGGITFLVR